MHHGFSSCIMRASESTNGDRLQRKQATFVTRKLDTRGTCGEPKTSSKNRIKSAPEMGRAFGANWSSLSYCICESLADDGF